MIAIILALPAPRVRSLLEGAAAALTQVGQATDLLETDSVQRVVEYATTTKNPHCIVLLTRCDRDWTRLLKGARTSFAYLHSDPVELIGQQQKLVEARQVMMRLTSFVELLEAAACVRIDATHDHGSEEQLLGFVAAKFGIEHLPPAATSPPWPALPSAGAADELDATVRAGLGSFATLREGKAPKSVLMSRMFFSDATRGGAPVSGAIDATGRPQLLFFGPYAYLPSGVWRARVVLTLSEQLIGASFRMDAVAQLGTRSLVEMAFEVREAGRKDVIVEFVHQDPADPVEVRFSSTRGIFDGEFFLGYVEFSLVEPRRGEA